jgi:membrane protease YdiL (CAAX protease family)
MTIAGLAFIYLAIFPAIGETESAARLGAVRSLPFGLRAAIVLRAAIFEEFFYRGFMIERLAEITGVRWLAALASLVAFTLGHVADWGFGHILVAGFGGGVLTVIYLWRRDLVATVVAHFLTDGIGLLF